jgi:hypothetical protein
MKTIINAEEQRYGRDKETQINNSYIDSNQYRRKFDMMSENIETVKTLYQKSKEMLKHRAGTLFEDMYWIDDNTGLVIASITNSTNPQKVEYPPSFVKALSKYENVISIHNHPHSYPPSIPDFNSALANNYKTAYVICHNGTIYGYRASEHISYTLFDKYTEKFMNFRYNEQDAYIMALKQIAYTGSLEFWEV